MATWPAVFSLMFLAAAGGAAKTGESEKIALWPLLRYDPQPGRTDLEILWPLLLDAEKTPDDTTWRVLLTVYHHNKNQNKTTWDFLWPVWRMQSSSIERHFRFVPLFFGHDSNERYIVLFPEVWWFDRTDSDRYFLLVFPWGRSYGGRTDYNNFLTPVIWGRDGQRRWAIVLPLGWWLKNAEDDYRFVCLLAFHGREGRENSITGLLPWWVSRRGNKQFANLFPVLWSKEGRVYKSFIVLPLYYNIGETAVFFPLYWDFQDATIILPIYGKGRLGKAEWEAFGPGTWIRWSKDGYRETDIFYPIIQWGEGPECVVRIVRPFYDYWREKDYEQRSLLLHLIARGRGHVRQLDRVFPLFNYDRTREKSDLSVLWPLYREKTTQDSRQRRILTLLPMGLFKVGANFDALNVLTLFYWAKSRLAEDTPGFLRAHGLYPLYSYTRERKQFHFSDYVPEAEEGKKWKSSEENHGVVTFAVMDLLTAIAGKQFEPSRTPLAILKVLFPILTHQRATNGYQKWALPLALFRYEKGSLWNKKAENDLSLTVGTPLVFHRVETKGTFGQPENFYKELHVLALFWDKRRKDYLSQGLWPLYSYKAAGKSTNISALDPLWFWGEATGEEEHVSALFKILDYRKQPNGDSRFSVIWRAFRRDERGATTTTEMFPFLAWETSPERSKFSFFWRLFAYEQNAGRTTLRLFFLPKFSVGGAK
ncbi:MAG: hypothetical protein N3D11_01865 [Candidatus Sumerlaeia bacterium]|nr:hypothetical protein [Candidatus Sumerlaeia bacterium]